MFTKQRGFALAYAFIVSTVFLVFFAALALGFRDTVRAVRFSEDSVKCRALADLGNELVYQIFLSHGLSFIPPDLGPGGVFKFSNDRDSSYYLGGMAASPNRTALEESLDSGVLGGTFTVTIRDARSLDSEMVPDRGTFWTMDCQSQVNSRTSTAQASSRFLVKVGVPFVNYLRVGSGEFEIRADEWQGPICGASSSTSGLPRLRLRSANTLSHLITGLPVKSDLTVGLQGLLRSMGPIEMIEADSTTFPDPTVTVVRTLGPGTYSAGDQILSPLAGTGPGIGGVLVTGALTVEPFSGLPMRQDETSKVLESVRSQGAGAISLDVSSYPGGVLVEVLDGTVSLYQANVVSVGKIYDLGLVLSIFKPGKPLDETEKDDERLVATYGSDAAAMDAAILEATWDDPAWPEEPYPSQLLADAGTFVTDNGLSVTLPTSGDFFELKRVERGSPISVPGLGALSNNWTTLRLFASSLTADGHLGAGPVPKVAPTVYFRGRVDGKLFLAYDLEGSASDLAESDGTANVIAILDEPEGMVPAGVRLADETVITDPQSEDTGSDDMVILAARGQVRSWGLPRRYADQVYPDSGPAQDFLSSESITGEEWFDMGESTNGRPVTIYGVTFADRDSSLQRGITADGRIEKFRGTTAGLEDGVNLKGNMPWSEADPSGPLGGMGGNLILPRRMRLCFLNREPAYNVYGARSGLVPFAPSASPGKRVYDYRWRDLTAELLGETLGLPVGPMLIDRRGL